MSQTPICLTFSTSLGRNKLLLFERDPALTSRKSEISSLNLYAKVSALCNNLLPYPPNKSFAATGRPDLLQNLLHECCQTGAAAEAHPVTQPASPVGC